MGDECEFKFNFKPTEHLEYNYDENIREILYPHVVDPTDDIAEYAVQQLKPDEYRCLLCHLSVNTAPEVHLQSKAHTKRLFRSHNDTAFKFYHEVFMNIKVNPIIQVYFSPCSAKQVVCVICGDKLFANQVVKHVLTKDLNDFDPNYADHIVYSDLIHEVRPELAEFEKFATSPNSPVFNIVGKANVCVICKDVFEKPTSEHVHTVSLDARTLLGFHKYKNFWPKQREEVQEFQSFYVIHSMLYLECIVCRQHISYDKVVGHINEHPCGFLHPDDPLNESACEWDELRREFIQETLCFPMDYDDNILMTYYPERVMDEAAKIDEIGCYFIQRQLDSTRCLICRDLLEGVFTIEDILAHIKSEFHAMMAYKKENLSALAAYHKFWLQQPVHQQMLQHKFRPYTEKQLKCVTCHSKVPTLNILEHVSAGCTIGARPKKKPLQNVQNVPPVAQTKPAQPKPTQKKPTKKPKKRFFAQVYPPVVQVPATSVVLNKLSSTYIYPTHKPVVPNNPSTTHIPPTHRPVVEISQPTASSSAQQLPRASSANEVSVPIAPAVAYKTRMVRSNSSTPPPKTKRVRQRKPKQVVEPEVVSEPPPNPELYENLQKDRFLLRTPTEELLYLMSVVNPESSSGGFEDDSESSSGSSSVQLEAANKADSMPETEYAHETISTIYGNYNVNKGQRRPDLYFMQKRPWGELFCLICDCSVQRGSPYAHINGKKHSTGMTDKVLRAIVIAYHRYWTAQAPTFQLDQVFYGANTVDTTLCSICDKELRYSNVAKHNCPRKFEADVAGAAVGPKFKDYQIKYTDSTKHLYCGQTLDVSLYALSTSMPVGMLFNERIACMLCNKTIARDPPHHWLNHLLWKHYSEKGKRTAMLNLIHEFHEFWKVQEPHLQILQVHYLPRAPGVFRCSKGHEVACGKALDHVTTCKVKKLGKFLEKYGKLTAELQPYCADSENMKAANGVGSAGTSRSDSTASDPDQRRRRNGAPKVQNADENGEADAVHTTIAEKDSTSEFGYMPPRFRQHLKYLSSQKGEKVRCSICESVFNAERGDIFNHITLKSHLDNSRMATATRYTYYCDVCINSQKTERAWLGHLDSTAHSAKQNSLSTARRNNVQEHECVTCNAVLFGDSMTLIRHAKAFTVKKEKKNSNNDIFMDIHPDVFKLFKSSESTTAQGLALVALSDVAFDNESNLQSCLKGLEAAVAETYPGSVAHPFGSRVTRIGNAGSDLDVFLDIGGMYDGMKKQEQRDQQEIVLRVKNLLSKARNFSHVYPITGARTPIVRVVHDPTKIDCDVSFRHGLSVENTKFMKFCLDVQPITKMALLLLKKWADIVSLRDEITSYALVMMFIFQLQLQGYLLSINRLRELSTYDVPVIDGWDTLVYTKSVEELKKYVTPYKGTVFEMLKSFFEFYMDFDYDIELICPLLGRTILVSKFLETDNGQSLPPEMAAYSRKVAADSDCFFKVNAAICVQDPFDLAHNLTKAVGKNFRGKFKRLCMLTYEHMNV